MNDARRRETKNVNKDIDALITRFEMYQSLCDDEDIASAMDDIVNSLEEAGDNLFNIYMMKWSR